MESPVVVNTSERKAPLGLWILVAFVAIVCLAEGVCWWAQVADYKERVSKSQQQLDGIASKLAAAQATLDQTRKDISTISSDRDLLAAQLDSAQKELTDVTNQLDRTKQSLAAKSRVPVTVTFRTAVGGPGLVVFLKNNSDRTLSIAALFQNPTFQKSKSVSMELRPEESAKYGYGDGWPFASGGQNNPDQCRVCTLGRYNPLNLSPAGFERLWRECIVVARADCKREKLCSYRTRSTFPWRGCRGRTGCLFLSPVS